MPLLLYFFISITGMAGGYNEYGPFATLQECQEDIDMYQEGGTVSACYARMVEIGE